MIANSTSTSRPMFISPDEWLDHYEACVRDGRRSWEPATRDELLLAESLGILTIHPEWIPCRWAAFIGSASLVWPSSRAVVTTVAREICSDAD